jgi:hypothetical protein
MDVVRVLDDLVDLPDAGARDVGRRQPLLPGLGVFGRQRNGADSLDTCGIGRLGTTGDDG